MKRVTDISKPSNQQLVDLINLDNNLSLIIGEVDIGIPKANTDTQISTCNTVLKLAKRDVHYGTVDIYYDRINMSSFNEGGIPNIRVSSSPSLIDILNAFNAFYSSNISISELDLSVTIPTPNSYGVLMQLKVNSKSLVWIGQCTINLKLL